MLKPKKIDKILSPSEKVEYQFSLSERFLKIKKTMAIFLGFIILLVLGVATIKIFDIDIILVVLIAVCFLALLIGLSVFYFDWYLKISNVFILTDKRIIAHRG